MGNQEKIGRKTAAAELANVIYWLIICPTCLPFCWDVWLLFRPFVDEHDKQRIFFEFKVIDGKWLPRNRWAKFLLTSITIKTVYVARNSLICNFSSVTLLILGFRRCLLFNECTNLSRFACARMLFHCMHKKCDYICERARWKWTNESRKVNCSHPFFRRKILRLRNEKEPTNKNNAVIIMFKASDVNKSKGALARAQPKLSRQNELQANSVGERRTCREHCLLLILSSILIRFSCSMIY